MEIFDQILGKLDKIEPGLEAIAKHITKPAPAPVFKLDSEMLATELMPHLAAHRKAMEAAAARMEAAAASIPKTVKIETEKVHAIEWPTAGWLLLLVASVAATAVYLVMVGNPAVARYLDDKNVETRAHLEYHIERNPKTELGYYNRR